MRKSKSLADKIWKEKDNTRIPRKPCKISPRRSYNSDIVDEETEEIINRAIRDPKA